MTPRSIAKCGATLPCISNATTLTASVKCSSSLTEIASSRVSTALAPIIAPENASPLDAWSTIISASIAACAPQKLQLRKNTSSNPELIPLRMQGFGPCVQFSAHEIACFLISSPIHLTVMLQKHLAPNVLQASRHAAGLCPAPGNPKKTENSACSNSSNPSPNFGG